MKKHIFVVALLSMAVVAIPAHANYVCTGTISNLSAYAPATGGYITLNVSSMNTGTTLCSLSANFGNWTPDTCKGAYAIVLSAYLSGKQVAVEFNDNLSCTTQPVGAGQLNSNYAVYIPVQ